MKAYKPIKILALLIFVGKIAFSQCLVADYPFSGNTNDISGNGYNTINYGATLTTDRFGNENSAYRFNGIDNEIVILPQYEPSFNFTDSLTVSSWVKLNENSTLFAAVVSKEEYGGYGLCVNLYGSKKFYFSIHSGGDYHSIQSIAVPELQQWYFLTGTYKVNEQGVGIMKFYVNGELQGTQEIYGGGQITNTDVPVTIGANPRPNLNGTKFLNGSIDDVKISQCVLSQEQIDSLYQPVKPTCLIADYPFSGNTNDISGNNYNGFVNGAILTTDRNGNENSAYYFDGIDDYINLSVLADEYRENMSSLTVSFWVNFEDNYSSDYGKTIISLSGLGDSYETNVFEIELENNQLQVETETGNGTNHEYHLGNTPNENEWFHMTCVFDDNIVKYYKNSELITTFKYLPAETSVDKLYLGGFACESNQASCFFKGKIDEVKVYNCVFSENEIIANFNPTQEIIKKEKINPQINIFPNPTNHTLKIESKTDLMSEYEIYDINGKLLRHKKISSKYKEINISDLPASIYLINIYVGENRIVKRFIKS